MSKGAPIGALYWKNAVKSRRFWIYVPSSSCNAPVALPPLIAAFVEATNSFDLEGLMATFADDALVNDQLRDYWAKRPSGVGQNGTSSQPTSAFPEEILSRRICAKVGSDG
jgi:hypothetical protein